MQGFIFAKVNKSEFRSTLSFVTVGSVVTIGVCSWMGNGLFIRCFNNKSTAHAIAQALSNFFYNVQYNSHSDRLSYPCRPLAHYKGADGSRGLTFTFRSWKSVGSLSGLSDFKICLEIEFAQRLCGWSLMEAWGKHREYAWL